MKYSNNQINGLVKEIVNYENQFHGNLISKYTNVEEFKKDLINMIKEDNGITKVLNFYELLLNNLTANHTGSKKKGLEDIILILQGYAY